MNDFGKVIVTGAGGGIGRATAKVLALAGAHVVATDLDPETIAITVNQIKAAGRTAQAVTGDITKQADVDALMSTAGEIRCLVNNAGIFDVKAFDELTAEDFRRVYEVNVVSMFRLCQLAAKNMAPGSAIINIASRAMMGGAAYAHYAASKAAVIGLTRSLALALADRDITVNAVAPGVIETDILKALPPEEFDKILAMQPGRKLGRPSDIAEAVRYLSAPTTRFVNGQVLLVDGGRSLGGFSSV